MYRRDINSEQALKNLEKFEQTVSNHIAYRSSVLLHYKLGSEAIIYIKREIELIRNHKVGIIPKGTIQYMKKNIRDIENDKKHHCNYLYTDNTIHHEWKPTGYMSIKDFIHIAEDKL